MSRGILEATVEKGIAGRVVLLTVTLGSINSP